MSSKEIEHPAAKPAGRGGIRLLRYTAQPAGIDAYWTTPLEVYCYLYHHPEERAHLQTKANEEETRLRPHLKRKKKVAELFHVWHRRVRVELRVRAQQPDELFLNHLQYLLAQEGVHVPNPDQANRASSYPLVFTNN